VVDGRGGRWQTPGVLLDGINHVAVLTSDTDRLVAFYGAVFGSRATTLHDDENLRMTIVQVGPTEELNVFQIPGNTEHERQVPMFGRGRLDHLALQASSIEAFDTIRDRLVERGASDGFVTDFGPILSLFFRDPDGLEAEVCVTNPDRQPGVHNPPGTPSRRYHPNGAPS
jgi:catechol 2,3-dioxygenase-like lactoylglutathione lyase family enzyme